MKNTKTKEERKSKMAENLRKLGQNYSKNAQSEAVGFVIIILLVVIVSVIFLGIYLRKSKGVVIEDAEIANFLSASQDYTTECYKDSEPFYRDLGDLIKDCYQQNTAITCPQDKNPCEVLNTTYSEMLSKFMPAGTLAYYRMVFYYQAKAEKEEEEIEKEKIKFGPEIIFGDVKTCVTRKAGRSSISITGGNIIIELEICRA